MKRLFTLLFLAAWCAPMGSCDYDDDDLWNAVDDLDARVEALEEASRKANQDIQSLRGLVAALEGQVTIESVERTADGYTIRFSEGDPVEITNGKDGIDAPSVAVRQDTDGIYYWTLGGEWLTDDRGEKLRVSGADGVDGSNGADGAPGAPGKDAVAPQVRIDPGTKEWEISTDGGETWSTTGIRAEGRDADALFASVDVSDPDWVVFALRDGSSIRFPRNNMSLVVEGFSAEGEFFRFGEVRTWTVTARGVADFTISKPDGWRVSYADGTLTVTAPAAENAWADRTGVVAVHAVSEGGFSRIVKLNVEAAAYRLRVLTFEDADYKGQGNYLGNRDWSSLVDSRQYNGPLLYPEGEELYRWEDTNNTFLASEFANGWGDFKFWGGGHALSDYVDTQIEGASFSNQLAVCYKDPATGHGGHGGSKNFCIHNGYADNFNPVPLPYIYFIDGVARVVDHMWVMNTTYVLNSVVLGDSFSGSPFAQGDFLKIVATGYDANGEKVEPACEIMLAHDGDYLKEWTRWDLSSLGEVMMIEFNISGSKTGSYGLNTPAYFAYDDVAVRF